MMAVEFKSGISVGPVETRHRRPEESKAKAKSGWGTVAMPRAVTEAGKAMAVGVPRTPVTDMPVDADEARNKPGEAEAPPPHRRKVETAPFEHNFYVVSNEGEGDCAYCSIGQALRDGQPPSKTYSPDDLRPRGKVQADLRLLTAAEMRKNWKQYLFASATEAAAHADCLKSAGFYAGVQTLMALAQCSNLDIRVWAWSESFGRWHLYHIKPWKNAGKKKAQAVWLKLHSKH